METFKSIISTIGGFFLAAVVLFLLGANLWMDTFEWLFALLYIFLWFVCGIIINIWLGKKF